MTENEAKKYCDGAEFNKEKVNEMTEDHLVRFAEGQCSIADCPMNMLRRIDLNTQQAVNTIGTNHDVLVSNTKTLEAHGKILETIVNTQKKYMGAIAKNTKHVALNLKEYNKNNQKMVALLSDKKQVPLSVFLVILLSIGIITVMMFAAFTHYQLILDESSARITHKDSKVEQAK